jgi:hypothetical protein
MEWDVMPFENFRGPSDVECVRGYSYIIRDLTRLPSPIDPLVMLLGWIQDRMRDQQVSQLIRVPKAFLGTRRRQIMENLKLKGSSEWVSGSDVLMAWWLMVRLCFSLSYLSCLYSSLLQTSYSHHRSYDTRSVFLHIPVNLRRMRIFPGASILSEPYINNASSTIPVPAIRVNAIHLKTLDDLALRIRRATTEYNADLLTLEHELRWCNAYHRMLTLHRCCPCCELSELQTNWCETRLSELEFSGARLAGSEKSKRARVLFVFIDTAVEGEQSVSLRGTGAILMEDENAIWMSQVKSRREWEKLRRSGCFDFI